MNFEEYSEAALSTSLNMDKDDIIYPVLGLCGESGEVAEKIKKLVRDKSKSKSVYDFDANILTNEDKNGIAKELGDILWYINRMAWGIDYTLQEVAQLNIEKLQSRKARNVIHGNGDER